MRDLWGKKAENKDCKEGRRCHRQGSRWWGEGGKEGEEVSCQPKEERKEAGEAADDCEADGGGGGGTGGGVDALLPGEGGQGEQGGGDAGNERRDEAGGKETPQTGTAE